MESIFCWKLHNVKPETSHDLHKTDLTAAFQFYFAVMYVINTYSYYAIRRVYTDHSQVEQRWWTTLSSSILSFYISALLVSPCELRSSFIALSACPERPRGAAEWPVAPLTLRAAVTLHHPALHLGWCGHLATGARVRRSWTRGYWEINRYASAQPSELPAWLAGWLPSLPSPSLPSLHSSSPSPLLWPNEDDAVLTFPHLAVCGYPVTG